MIVTTLFLAVAIPLLFIYFMSNRRRPPFAVGVPQQQRFDEVDNVSVEERRKVGLEQSRVLILGVGGIDGVMAAKLILAGMNQKNLALVTNNAAISTVLLQRGITLMDAHADSLFAT